MALLVLTYPDLKEADYDWIQSIREKYDQLDYQMIGPHFTLVFPVDGVDRSTFTEHVRTVSRRSVAFPFELRCAVVVYGRYNDKWHVFLAPDQGYSGLVRLHRDLYTGPLAEKARFDEPYVPHVTVGKFDTREAAGDAAERLDTRRFRIEGKVRTIDIVDYTDGHTTSVDRFELRPE